MNDFSTYRLNDLAELDELERAIGTEKFYAYLEAVYKLCGELTPGAVYNIAENIKAENRELFIKLCCRYMLSLQPKGECNIEFEDKYFTEIRGVQTFNDSMREWDEINKQWEKK
ncbi:MAG: hypothetical protein FWC39_10285 [Bacteroidetes bacterium]|nr:hypothetical protein [Bacteroidota bacterium]